MKFILCAYIVTLNVLGFCITLNDKFRAKRKLYRVRESTLWKLSLLGGAFGIFTAMIFSRHKTKHLSFMLLLPLIIAVQTVALLLFIC